MITITQSPPPRVDQTAGFARVHENDSELCIFARTKGAVYKLLRYNEKQGDVSAYRWVWISLASHRVIGPGMPTLERALEEMVATGREVVYFPESGYQEFFRWLGTEPPKPCLNEKEQDFCHSSQPIQAIKSLRERYGLGLKEAKDLVDEYRESQGLMQKRAY